MTTDRVRALIIDDVDDQRQLLLELFSRVGSDAVGCASTPAARELLKKSSFEIVVIDLLLSGDDNGWKALDVVRELAPDAAVVISSVLDIGDFPPADAYLPKPFTRSQVQELVERIAGTA